MLDRIAFPEALKAIEHLGATNQAIYPIRDPYGLLDGFYFGPQFRDEAES